MQIRIIRFLLVVVMSVMVLPGMALAQSDDEAHDVVLSAVQDTIALEGYHLALKSSNQSTITQADGFVTNTYTILDVEGDVAQNGDRHFMRETLSADTFENTMEAPPFVVEQVVSDGVNYVNFQTAGTIYEDMLEIQPGWWEYDHLVESADSAVTTGVIQQFVQTETPLESLFHDDIVLSVTELEPETDSGVNLRVFDVELDAVQLLLAQTPGTDEEKQQLLAESGDLLEASDITATYQLWIGADDGLVYRGKGEQRSVIPYATSGTDNDPDFDMDNSGTVEFTVSQHGEAVEITPPDPASLNE
jgi:hypothetical protein